MSRDTTWGTVAHALRHSWSWPADPAEIDDLAARFQAWADLAPLLAAVEYYQRNQPDRRPSVNELTAEARRRREANNAPTGHPAPCPTCNAEGWLIQGYIDAERRLPELRPCPTCRPGTAQLHAAGHYRLDAPTLPARAPAVEAARDANDAAPRYGPRRPGSPVARPAAAARATHHLDKTQHQGATR